MPHGLPELRPNGWSGGPNSSQSPCGEWYRSAGYKYSMRLTDWPQLEKSWSPFIPVHDSPLCVEAVLNIYGKTGASLSINVNQQHVKTLVNWKDKISVASAQRRALAFLYDRHVEIVRDALVAFYGRGVYGDRCLIVGEDGTPLATFVYDNDATYCRTLPNHFYEWCWSRYHKAFQAYEVNRSGSCIQSSSSPEITARVAAMLRARSEGNDGQFSVT